MNYDFDLFVIGGGSGGVRAARLAGQLGRRVAIAEQSRMGGTCVIRGCVPKKLMVYASSYSEVFQESSAFGWSTNNPIFSWERFSQAKNKELSRLENLYRDNLTRHNVRVFDERATLADAHTVELASGVRVTADIILIATGSKVTRPKEILGIEHCISSDDVFDLENLPESMVIAGGGYIAVEFAFILQALGVKTTLVYRGDLVLKKFDHDLRALASLTMVEKGIDVIYHAYIIRVEKDKRSESDTKFVVTLDTGQKLTTDRVLTALGRTANTQNLGLDNVGVQRGARGEILVDALLQTTQPNIYALGDVIDKIQLTPVAIHEAMCFIQTVFHGRPTEPDRQMVATAVFSQPEIGTVGLTETEAARSLANVEIFKTEFRPMRNTLTLSPVKTLMKLVVDRDSDIVVGAHIFGPDAGEIIQALAIALKGKVTKKIFDQTMAVHPTATEELVTMYQPTYYYKNGMRVS